MQFWPFSKKRRSLSLIYFRTYGLGKTWLEKCVKSPILEDPSTSNTVNRPKHCWNLNDSTFTIFIDPSDRCSCWRGLPERYSKYQDFLLIHSLRIRSILFLIETFYSNIFRWNYLRNEIYFIYIFFFIL